MTDSSTVLVDGPWRHHFVAANGARFHVVVSEPAGATEGTAPLVVLLHGFPQMWWAWRHQLPALAAAGYRAVAMDLRGAGASDKPPIGNDVPTLARDVAGVVRSLGARDAVVVGQGIGGTVAWSMPALQPDVTRAVAAFSAPHPAAMHTAAVARHLVTRTTARRLGFFQLPWLPERRMLRGDLAVRLLTEWGAPGWLPDDVAATYRSASRVPFAAHSGMEQLRWLVRSTPRVDGQRYLAAVRQPVDVPVLQVHGAADRCIPVAAARAAAGVAPGAPLTFRVLAGAGHFLAEEASGETTGVLLDWLRDLR